VEVLPINGSPRAQVVTAQVEVLLVTWNTGAVI